MAATGPAPARAASSGRRSSGPTSRSTSRARRGEPPPRPSWARKAASRPRRPIQNPLPTSPRRCPHPSTQATALSTTQPASSPGPDPAGAPTTTIASTAAGPAPGGSPGPSATGQGRPSAPITAARQRLRPPSTATRLPILAPHPHRPAPPATLRPGSASALAHRYSAADPSAGGYTSGFVFSALRRISEGGQPDDGPVEPVATGGAEEPRVAEGEDPAVGRHQPVALPA